MTCAIAFHTFSFCVVKTVSCHSLLVFPNTVSTARRSIISSHLAPPIRSFRVIAELRGGHQEGHRFGHPVHLFKILRQFLGPYHSEPPQRPSFLRPPHPSDDQLFLETTLECHAFESLWLIHLSRPACGLRFSEGHTHPQRSLSLLLHPQCLRILFVHHWCLRSQPNLLSDNASMVTLPKYRLCGLRLPSLHPSLSGFNGFKRLGLLNRSSIMSPLTGPLVAAP